MSIHLTDLYTLTCIGYNMYNCTQCFSMQGPVIGNLCTSASKTTVIIRQFVVNVRVGS